jgi:hypothetical protein
MSYGRRNGLGLRASSRLRGTDRFCLPVCEFSPKTRRVCRGSNDYSEAYCTGAGLELSDQCGEYECGPPV